MSTIPWRETRDQPILGGWAYLGSAVWAALHFGFGYLLWELGAYIGRGGVDPVWMLATLALACAAVVFRRGAPMPAFALGVVALVIDAALLGPSAAVVLVFTDLLYAVGAWGRRKVAWGVFGVMLAGMLAVTVGGGYLLWTGRFSGGALNLLQSIGLYDLVFLTPMVTGLSIRAYHDRAETERRRAEQVVRMAELDRAGAVGEERARMARELHDVIANHLSAIAVQSTAALSMRELEPELVRRVLSVVRDSSVQGLAEMRRMIGVLRADDDLDLHRELPQLSEADRLVAQAREAGLTVRWRERGEAGALPVQLDAAAYRIVQESLTNALRHATPKRVEITVEHARGNGDGDGGDSGAGGGAGGYRLAITAENGMERPSRRGSADVLDGAGAGAGLTGMRERVTLLGGVFSAGPRPGGVWRVRAELPVEPADGGARPGADRHNENGETGLDA